MPRTIPQLFEDSASRFASNTMMWEKRGASYTPSTYAEIRTRVHECAAGLIHLGIRPGDRMALIAEGRNDWVVSELGILYAGAINVPLSVKIEELNDLKFRLAHSGCRMVIVSATQAEKIAKVRKDLPDLERTILLDGRTNESQRELGFEELLSNGREYLTAHRDEFEKRWQGIQEGDAANICYTSGTTADPKGIILSHRNYTANVEQASALLPIPESYCSLLILPWDHAFAHTAGVYTLMANGASMASVQLGKTPMESLKNIPVNIRETRPTFLLSVPSLAKNLRKNIEKGIREKGEKVERLFNRALEVAYTHNGDGFNRGQHSSLLEKLQYKVFDVLLFRKVRANLGGRLEFFIGGGALLDIELQRFFYAIGIPMFQGYGLTEAAPIISANVPKRHKLGSSGTIVSNLQVKICDEEGRELGVGAKGEIVVKGENVMLGYWKNERATSEALRDGWLYTGDLGYRDSDGFLYVLGRAKSLLIAHDGEKYSPEGIEEAIVGHSPYIDQAMLYNNQSPYTVALIVPNREALTRYLRERGLSIHSPEGEEAALRLLESQVQEYRTGGAYAGMFPERWLPSAIAVLGEAFTEQNQFLNSTLKMVRGKIAEHYKARIDHMFTPEGKDVCNYQNRALMKWLE